MPSDDATRDIFSSGVLAKGTGSRLTVERELDRRAERFEVLWGGGYYYNGRGDFIREHGTLRQGAVVWPLPDQYKPYQGQMSWCFRNSFEAAKACPELRYCEGIYMVGSDATPHAWCLDPDDRVIELTLPVDDMAETGMENARIRSRDGYARKVDDPTTWTYYGVVLPLSAVEARYQQEGFDPHDTSGSIPVLDDGEDEEGVIWSGSPSNIFRKPWRPA